MNRSASFIRKVVYLSAVALLLIPLSYLCQPSAIVKESAGEEGEEKTVRVVSGGKLAQLRAQHGISQAQLGEVDPAGETLKLATLGLRGVAANLLWLRAQEHKKTENWDQLSVTLNQITKLQPNFLTVWEFQSHNLAYNVSMQFDNYEHRYHWVKKGIDFLIQGTRYNQYEPRLYWYVGWIIGQKIGMSDERLQFRRIFRTDDEFHQELGKFVDTDQARLRRGGADFGHDNWKMGALFHRIGEDLADAGHPLRGKSPLVFFQGSSKWQVQCAVAFVEEYPPDIDGVAQSEWRLAQQKWREYGDRQILSTFGNRVTLNGYDSVQDEVVLARNEIDYLVGQLKGELSDDDVDRLRKQGEEMRKQGERFQFKCQARRDLEKQKRDQLRKEDAQVVELIEIYEESLNPTANMTTEDYIAADNGLSKIRVTDVEVLNLIPESERASATPLVAKLNETIDYRNLTARYIGIVNFDYWKIRCDAEATDLAINARRNVFDAVELSRKGKFQRSQVLDENKKAVVDEYGDPIYEDGAKELFEQAWQQWHDLFEQNEDFARLWEDDLANDLVPAIREYRKIVRDLKEPDLPLDFPLMKLLNIRARKNETGLPSEADIRETHARAKKKTDVQVDEPPGPEDDPPSSVDEPPGPREDVPPGPDGTDGETDETDSAPDADTEADNSDDAGADNNGESVS